MDSTLPVVAATAIKPPAQNGNELSVTEQSGSDDENGWFSSMARMLGKDAGLALSVITGFPERTCYYYASGDRKPPAYFLRAILRSEQGEPFLRAVMDGCDQEWWRDFVAAADIGRTALAKAKQQIQK